MKRLVAKAAAGRIRASDVKEELAESLLPTATLAHIDAELRPGRSREAVVEEVERELYRQVKLKYGLQKNIAAALGVTQQAISSWKIGLGIDD